MLAFDGQDYQTLNYAGADVTGSAFTLNMSVKNGQYEIRINDELKHIEAEATPRNFENVTATIVARSDWNRDKSLPSGYYKNFKLWTQC